MIGKLLDAGASISAYDPAAMERAKAVLPPSKKLSYAASIYEAARHADAVLILTDWKEFAKLDLARLNHAVYCPIMIDGRNLYKLQEMRDHGFTSVSMGRPASYHEQEDKHRKLELSQPTFKAPLPIT